MQEGEAYAANAKLEWERRSLESETRLKTAGQEIERLNGLLKVRSEEFEAFRKQLNEY